MKKFALLFLALLSASCEKETFTIENLNGNRIILLGHAGMGIGNAYPMNSLESVMKCLNTGTDGTELDVQMTKDSVLVAFHDPDLSASTNLEGMVSSHTWADIREARYNQTPYLDYSVISLDQLFSSLPDPSGLTFTFDCKRYAENVDIGRFNEAFARALARIIGEYQLESTACIESQDPGFLKFFKTIMPAAKLFIYPSSFESGMETADSLGLAGITISTREISEEQVAEAHRHNLLVAIWNIHSEAENIEAINKNPNYIQTDKVRNLVELLK